ncbi:MAG TPA: hypothetical protein VMV18_06160, partial [bacterium]|nr:hypothetical protein [bacterium]
MNAFRIAPIRERALQLVEKYSEANVPTVHGVLRVVVFRDKSRRAGGGEPLEHMAIIAGDVSA